MKSILVIGVNGQLGQCIKALTRNNTDNYIFLNSKDLDIRDKSSVETFFLNKNVDWCINCAAYTQVDRAEEESSLAHSVNALGSKYIAQICAKKDIKLIHISTDFVFNGTSNIAYTEKDKVDPINVYGRSKLDGEKHITKIAPKFYIIRTSWLYSEYANNFMKKILELSKSREELGIVTDQIGTPTYAVDLANVILKIIDLDNDRYGIYHYSNEGVASWYDFAHSIIYFSKLKTKINPIFSKDFPTLAERPIFSVLNKHKIKLAFGVTIPHWQKSLEVCIQSIHL